MSVRRRDALLLLLYAWITPFAAAQPTAKVHRLAWLSGGAIVPSAVWTEFVAAMRDLGWIEGKHYTVENLRYDGQSERLRVIAAEAVDRKFDLIICAGTPPALAAQRTTRTIPIVFYFVGDPVGAGLVASLARPGGNVTGLGGLGPGIYAKMLELLREAAPRANHIAMLLNSTFALHAGFAADAQAAARRLQVSLTPVELRSPEDIDSAFATIGQNKADALLILGQPFLVGQGPRVARLALEQRLPTVVPFDGVVGEGILMSYGSSLVDDVRRVPYYIDRILKGADPGALSVEQPTRFYLTINLGTAKALGLALPTTLLQRADRVIQ